MFKSFLAVIATALILGAGPAAAATYTVGAGATVCEYHVLGGCDSVIGDLGQTPQDTLVTQGDFTLKGNITDLGIGLSLFTDAVNLFLNQETKLTFSIGNSIPSYFDGGVSLISTSSGIVFDDLVTTNDPSIVLGLLPVGAYSFAFDASENARCGWGCLGNANWSLTGTVDTPVSPVPLPAAGWMLLAGIGGLFAWHRRKRAA